MPLPAGPEASRPCFRAQSPVKSRVGALPLQVGMALRAVRLFTHKPISHPALGVAPLCPSRRSHAKAGRGAVFRSTGTEAPWLQPEQKSASTKKLREPTKVYMMRHMLRPALDLVLSALEQMRDDARRLPWASKATIERLVQNRLGTAPSGNLDLLAPVQARVAVCSKCPHLATTRTQTVFGVGNPHADLMFVGEAPGADEDAKGEPFVGRAGQLLTKIIETMGFSRDHVYIANVLKCRPDVPRGSSGNRAPTPAEMDTCKPYLLEQIKIIQPKVLVALGAVAVEGLLGARGTMRDLRGRWHSFHGTPLMITYHPAYLLRNQSPSEKRKVWEDMLQVLERLECEISEKQRNYFL
ncbi:MAG: uracil-DNA glycosylase [Verrucomicrobiota bacterium]